MDEERCLQILKEIFSEIDIEEHFNCDYTWNKEEHRLEQYIPIIQKYVNNWERNLRADSFS